MRYWNRRADPNTSEIRKRSRVRGGAEQFANFRQKPLFGRVDESGEGPVISVMPPEGRLDDLTPEDKTAGNSGEPLPLFVPAALVTYVAFNVSGTPTAAEFDEAFGVSNKNRGFVGVLADGSTVAYIVISNGADWFFHQLTRAV